jgi:hypothetical protein
MKSNKKYIAPGFELPPATVDSRVPRSYTLAVLPPQATSQFIGYPSRVRDLRLIAH